MKPIKKNKQQMISASNLINQLIDTRVEKRVNSASNLKSIGSAIGKERIKSQLIPFLISQIIDDQNQVLTALISNVQVLGELLGGGIAYTCLFTLLQQILQNQDASIRRQCVLKYSEIVKLSELQKSQVQIISSIKRIIEFQYEESRQGAVLVAAQLYGKFNTVNQQLLINFYYSLVESQSLVLRRFAAQYSKYLVQWLNVNQPTILKIVQLLFKDKEESNKIYLIDTIIQLAKYKSPTYLQAYFNLISYQFTWRVRYELISKAQKLAQAMGQQNFKIFLSYFVKYLNDIEPEIRSISCIKLKQIVKFIQPNQIITRIIPALKNTHQDNHAYVRTSLAESLLILCPIIGKNNTNEFILPKFLHFLKDEDQKIRITIFKNISFISSELGIDTLSQSTMPALNDLIVHQNWRIRLESIQIFWFFVKNSGVQFMNQKNIKIGLDFIRDKAFAVRAQGIQLLVRILEQLGNAWFQKTMLSKLMLIFKSTNYLQRQIALSAVQSLLPKLTQQALNRNVCSSIINLCSDPVQNVRLTACRVLPVLLSHTNKDKELIKKNLKLLKDDKDKDVREMAEKMQKKISG